MPRKTSTRRRTGGGGKGKHQRGKGFVDFFRKVNTWFKDNKIISKVGNALGGVVPYASQIGSVAGSLGYGRKRGGALRLAGNGSRLAGGSRRKTCRCRKK